MEKLTVLLELTRRCNLKCKHCYNSSSPDSKIALTMEEIKQIVEDLKRIEQKYPIERIVLTGGEFITMDNSKEILELFKNNFNCIIRIETNGFLFCKNTNLFNEYNPQEFFLSIDKFHGSLKDDGSAPILETFIDNVKDKKIVVRVTIERGQEHIKEAFLEKYSHIKNLVIECKYVSPSGRAGETCSNFQGYLFKDNPALFKCLAKNYIHLNTTRKWFACYTACDLSYIAHLGDKQFLEKLSSLRESASFKKIREEGIIALVDEEHKSDFENKKFYYRCEPCLYLQQLKNKKITVLDLPAVDTAQDVYIKGFIFPTFSEKYLCPILEMENFAVDYHNLNKENVEDVINLINKQKAPIYIHLTANKYYSYSVFKNKINPEIPILIGGPFAKFEQSLFDREHIIVEDLEENGIFKYFNHTPSSNVWQSEQYEPKLITDNLYNNTSVTNDFANVVLFGRGCYFNCKFCIHSCYHNHFYLRNIKSIKKELDSYGNLKTSIYIADATVGVNRLYSEILELMANYKNLKFSMNIRADQITKENLKLLSKINIDKLYIGVESLSNEKLNTYQKDESIETISNALALLREHNINYHLSFIISQEYTKENIEFIKNKLKASSHSFHFYIPYPGTYGYDAEDKWYLDKHWPKNIVSRYENSQNIKKCIEESFNYPSNTYHTVTPHNHIETFKIIESKLNELENIKDYK